MKIKNIILSGVAILAAGLTSCDYLDVVPPEQPSVNNTMDNYTQALGFLYTCYKGVTVPVQSDWRQDQNINYCQPVPGQHAGDYAGCTDEWVMENAQAAPIVRANYSNTLSANNNLNVLKIYSIWLNNVFLFLEKLEEIGEPKGIADPATIKEWRAEAKFLQAFYHYRMLQRYGPIPIVERHSSLDVSSSNFPGRMHYDYCVNWICDKLDEAAQDLPATRASSEVGRATSVICKALKARILLYAASPLYNGEFPFPEWKNKVETPGYGYDLVSNEYDRSKWERALIASREALETARAAGHELYHGSATYETQTMIDNTYVPVDGADDDFKRAVLRMRNVNVLKVSEGNIELIWSSLANISNSYEYRARIIRNPLPKTTALPNGFTSSTGIVGPTLATILRFQTKDGYQPENDPNFAPEGDWYKSAGIPDNGDALRSHIINLNKNREPRFYAWIAFDGGDYGTLLKYGRGPVHINMLSTAAQGYDSSKPRDYSTTGWNTQKYINPRSNINESGRESYVYGPRNLIRVAELYLNIAECQAELGNTQEALNNINVIRRRAGAKELTVDMVATSGKSIVDWARDERSIELFDEMHRYFDLRRWAIGEVCGQGKRLGLNSRVNNPTFQQFNTVTSINQGHIYNWGDRMYLYPIDAQELYANPNMVQSPGY